MFDSGSEPQADADADPKANPKPEASGTVVESRLDAGRAPGIAGTGDTRTLTRDDLQARVSGANRVGADVFLSLHSNGSGDPSMRGVEVYYESRRPFADENYRLAAAVLDGALRGLAASGHPSVNRGIIDAAFAVVHDGVQRSVFASGRIPEDRHASLVPDLSVAYNLVLEHLDDYRRGLRLDEPAIRAMVEAEHARSVRLLALVTGRDRLLNHVLDDRLINNR